MSKRKLFDSKEGVFTSKTDYPRGNSHTLKEMNVPRPREVKTKKKVKK